VTEVDQEMNEGDRVEFQMEAQNSLLSVRWPIYWEETDEALAGMLVLPCSLRADMCRYVVPQQQRLATCQYGL
jgi:hypothetical protein